jgi:hypothetical protein
MTNISKRRRRLKRFSDLQNTDVKRVLKFKFDPYYSLNSWGGTNSPLGEMRERRSMEIEVRCDEHR